MSIAGHGGWLVYDPFLIVSLLGRPIYDPNPLRHNPNPQKPMSGLYRVRGFGRTLTLLNLSNPLETKPPPPELTNPTVDSGLPPTEPNTFGSIGGFPPQKPEPPDLTIKSTKSGDIQRFSDKNLQIPAIFLLFRRRATWNPPNPSRSSLDLMDSAKYRPDLDRFGKILAPAAKLETDWHKLETHGSKPDDPTIITSRFQFCFSPARKIWVRSRAQTRPIPTC